LTGQGKGGTFGGVFSRNTLIALGAGSAFLAGQVWAAETTVRPPEIPLKDVLVIRSVSRPGRSAVRVDPVEATVVAGHWQPPRVGDVVPVRDGEQRWEAATGDDKGVLKEGDVRGGYVYWPARSDREQVMILEAAGHGCVYVNGEIRAGDPYGFGYLRVPVLLRAGTNDFLFQAGRGDFRAKLVPAPGPLSIHTADSTLPDIILGETEPVWGATVLLNATTNFMRVSLRALERGSREEYASIPPLGMYKAPFALRAPARAKGTNSCTVTLEAVGWCGEKKVHARTQVTLRVRKPSESHRRTFVSGIDGSVQYYGVNPASAAPKAGTRPALFLSLHGAGVEAQGQADAYSPKKWGHIVCPTNRRPYGFDWEEWGRWDALEVLGLAEARFQPDPSQVYLTGHSMGGHGTWQLGVLFPDRFAAIAPSAGWISFRSYTSPQSGPVTNAMQQMLLRAGASSETLLMATNYAQEAVYILHGDADDNVPVEQAREMRKVLGEFHRDFDFYEQPGAGHWWDASDEAGTDCVDWAPMFDFFARHKIPADESCRRVRFTTVNPAVSARCHWVGILAQDRQLEPSSVDLRCDPGKRRVVGTTTNVSRLLLEFPSITPGPGLTIELDGQKLENQVVPDGKGCGKGACCCCRMASGLCLVRESGKWMVSECPAVSMKSPERSGPFRQAFKNHMALVYGTKGTTEENAWTLAKARYDAETFYYRGNGAIELISDVDVMARREKGKKGEVESRNFIIYGNADCNAAWAYLLGKSPVQAQRGHVRAGDREMKGEDVGVLFLQPNPADASALVGVVGGSGIAGMRVTERMPYFLSGAGFPDCMILSTELPAKGIKGVRAAGFFGQDWQVGTGDFVWGE
jgi:dienelactone hydrolase